MVGMEVIVVCWEFVILQNARFSLIRFLSIEFQFHLAMPNFCCFWFCFAAGTSVDVFLLVLRLRRAFNMEF